MESATVKRGEILESQMVEIWQRQWLDSARLVTEDGEPIEIIYPGRLNDDQGADFRDAVIAGRQGIVKGDIELHVKSSDWRNHQHHRNPACNRVILHVVMWPDSRIATELQNGRSVPVLDLSKYLKTPVRQWCERECSSVLNLPCLKAGERRSPAIMAGFLDRAGEERFLAKAGGFQSDLARMGTGQSLYSGIMGALGYAKNKLPFLELACRLPLQTLEPITRAKISDDECLARLQALLLGTAGRLPSPRQEGHLENDKWVAKLEGLWAAGGRTEVMSRDAWHLFKVRPSNFPARRIAAMSHLLTRYREKGIFSALVNVITEVPVKQGHRRLEEDWLVITTGYWASHFDFGSSHRIENPTLLGRGRAAEIAVNVLLPFAFAWGRFSSQPGLESKAWEIYQRYPRLIVNSIERHMKDQLGLKSNLVNSARRQQGLIHIYSALCTQGKCGSCPLKPDLPHTY